jgi:hypothetical protein
VVKIITEMITYSVAAPTMHCSFRVEMRRIGCLMARKRVYEMTVKITTPKKNVAKL